MRYGVGPIPLRVGLRDKQGLKLRVPGQFKEMKSETKNPLGLLFFEGIFREAEVKNKDCCSSTCQSVLDSQASALPSSLNSVRGSKARTCMYHALHKGATAHHNTTLTAFPKSLHIRGGIVVPLSQSQTYAVFHLRNFSKHCLSVAQTGFGWGAHGERTRGEREVEDIQCKITKHFFKASSPPVQ